jgi:hypothetical protein
MEELLDIIADKRMIISDNFLKMVESKRDLKYTLGGIFSKNMRTMQE